MTLIGTYRRSLHRKREGLAKLTNDKVKIQKKISDYQAKAQKASKDAGKSKNTSTNRSRLNQAERFEKSAMQESNKLTKLEEKIAKKNEEIQKEESKLEKRWQEKHNRKMSNIDSTLKEHQVLHNQTFNQLEELKNLPEKIKVICFASNPTDQTPLKLGQEVRSIQEMLRKTKYRDSIKLEPCCSGFVIPNSWVADFKSAN